MKFLEEPKNPLSVLLHPKATFASSTFTSSDFQNEKVPILRDFKHSHTPKPIFRIPRRTFEFMSSVKV
jgi:hypothetical protein